MAPKTRSTRKNTAPKGVKPKGPTNENYLFPGMSYNVQQPRQVTWPQYSTNPADRGYLEPYDPITGLPTGQAPVNPYIPQIQPYPAYGPPLPSATTAAPTLAGVGAIPEYPMYGPPLPGATTAQEYAPNMTTGGSGSYGNPDYNYWVNLAQKQEQWTPEEQAAYLAQFYGQTDEQGNLIGVGNPRWGDPYQVMPYWKYDQPTWIAGREGGASSMGRGRRPKSSYLPEQQQYMDADGNTYFERPEMDKRSRWQKLLDEDNPSGNNTSKTIPAWVGPLVSWRT